MSTSTEHGDAAALDEPSTRAAAPLAFWAALLGALTGVHAAFGGGLLAVLVQGAAAAVIGALALGILVRARLARRVPRPTVRTVPDLSVASMLAAVSLAAILCGATIGSWLIIGGCLGLALAGGGLLRERRAQRRAAVAAKSREPRGEDR